MSSQPSSVPTRSIEDPTEMETLRKSVGILHESVRILEDKLRDMELRIKRLENPPRDVYQGGLFDTSSSEEDM